MAVEKLLELVSFRTSAKRKELKGVVLRNDYLGFQVEWKRIEF